MNKCREVFRLKSEQRLSNRQVAASCGISRRTVSQYWEAICASGLSWSQAQELSDPELEQRLFQREADTGRVDLPDWHHIHRELKRAHVTRQLLWQEYKEAHPDGINYSWFNELYGRWRGHLNIYMRQEHRAGEKLFVDYCDGLWLTDRQTGKKVRTQLFVAAWGASNYTYAEASLSQEMRHWVMSHARAYGFFGCVPQLTVPDNLKSGVSHACRYEPSINRSYLEMARHYGTTIIPARPNKPRDKAKVEVGVQVAQRWILACLRDRAFYSLGELNRAIRELLERLNNRPMRKLKQSRREQFEQLDRPAAGPLPARGYEYAQWRKARVNIDYHLEVEGHYYSVPYQLVGREVEVRLSENALEVFYKGRRQASHARSFARHRHSTLPGHMPEAHRRHQQWTPSRILDWAGQTGPCTRELARSIIESKQHPQQAYRSCLGIFRLNKHYPAQRIEDACRRALKYRTCSYRSLKAILAAGLDRQADQVRPVPVVSPAHENVRGHDYYRGGESHA
jgi:transposase